MSCEFRPQCVANSAWSFVTLSRSRGQSQLWDALAQQVEHVFAEGKQEPQHLANTLWGFGKVSYGGGKAIAVLLEQTRKELPGFNPQCLSNTAWAVAALSVEDQQIIRLSRRLGPTASPRWPSFETKNWRTWCGLMPPY